MKKLLAGALGTVLALGGLGVATATPAVAATQYVQPYCNALSVSFDGYPDGTTLTFVLDGETETVTFGGSHGFWRDLEWSTPHDWSVVVDAPEGSDGDFSDSGTTAPCDSDPEISAWVDASCGEIVASVSKYPAGSRVVTTIDGAVLSDETFDGSSGHAWSLDWRTAHDWSVVLDAADDTLDRTWSGTTEPCRFDPSLSVDVNAYCESMSVSVGGYPVGTAVVVRVGVDVVGEGAIDESGYFWGDWPVDGSSAQEWTVEIDAVDDALDRTESGVSEPCWVPPTTVEPVTPAVVTDCSATPDDVVLPDDTEGISYTRADAGIVATAAPGYEFPFGLDQWRPHGDGQLLLGWYAALRPSCAFEGVSVQPVCVEGVAYLDISVTPPAGATEDNSTFYIEWQGPGGGYEVVYGDAGFGHPWTARHRWPGFVTHDDGTVSPKNDPTWRLDDVDLVLYATVDTEGRSYSIGYDARVEDAPTADPCADDPGPRFSVEARERRLAGKAYVAVRVVNEDDSAADIRVVTPFGTREFAGVAPGTSAYQAFAVRPAGPTEGEAVVTFTTDVDGQFLTRERTVSFWIGW